MRVLVACEFSGRVRDAFRRKGHDAYSCDILPSEDPRYHFQGDVLSYLGSEWDLLVAHPPCTYLCNSGVRWLHTEDGRMEKMKDGAVFFRRLLDAPIEKKAIENPIPHKYAVEAIGKKYDQIIQPWQFGHGETKAVCLWLDNLPLLRPSKIVEGREGRVHKMPPSDNRGLLRSITYQGIADAMGDQWG